ncbi:MAG: hypothetical protein QXI12_11365 [Candidatus Methanomethyliaceae archaeon]
MNFRYGKDHDRLLISLVSELDKFGRIDILEKHLLGGIRVGRLQRAQSRRQFDVELTFDSLSCIIESKVDDDEDERGGVWQTERIYCSAGLAMRLSLA